MESFWFGLMALTSVGNGEKKPNSNIGKVAMGSNEIKLLLSKQITFLPVFTFISDLIAFKGRVPIKPYSLS